MYLPAISIGYAVPDENFDASVHSVFQSALNLRLNGEIYLLTLIAFGEGDLPQGIRLDVPKSLSFEDFQVGASAVCRDRILHFEKNSLTVPLSGARRWKCDLAALAFDSANPAVSAAWHFTWDVLNRRQINSESEMNAEELLHSNERAKTSVLRKAGKAMHALLDTTRRYDFTDVSAVDSLIGLGPGLTPSGDDLLVGYLAGLWCSAHDKSERAQFISSLGKTIIVFSEKTNEISRTYLYHAAEGQISSRLANLAEAICLGENSEHLLEPAKIAMSAGHTSGMDTVTGLLTGLAAWEGNHLLVD